MPTYLPNSLLKTLRLDEFNASADDQQSAFDAASAPPKPAPAPAPPAFQLPSWNDVKLGAEQAVGQVQQAAQGFKLPTWESLSFGGGGDSTGAASSPGSSAAGVGASSPSAPAAGGDLQDYARQAAAKAGIDPEIFVRQIQQESGFNPTAGSPAGAQGIAQIMPQYHPGVDTSDPYASLDYAANLMGNHLKKYGGDYSKALSAYNAGEGNTDSGAAAGFGETQTYIKNILGDGSGPTGAGPQTARNDRSSWQGVDSRTGASMGPSQSQSSTIDQSTLDDPDKWSLCGPVAAVMAAAAHGKDWTIGQAKALAQQFNLWDPQNGMHGLQAQVELLNRGGIAATVGDANEQRLAEEAQNGNTPIVSTAGHYYILKGYDPATGKFDTASTGSVYKKGAQWMSLADMQAVSGAVQGAAYMDNPASPTPSLVAATSSKGADLPNRKAQLPAAPDQQGDSTFGPFDPPGYRDNPATFNNVPQNPATPDAQALQGPEGNTDWSAPVQPVIQNNPPDQPQGIGGAVLGGLGRIGQGIGDFSNGLAGGLNQGADTLATDPTSGEVVQGPMGLLQAGHNVARAIGDSPLIGAADANASWDRMQEIDRFATDNGYYSSIDPRFIKDYPDLAREHGQAVMSVSMGMAGNAPEMGGARPAHLGGPGAGPLPNPIRKAGEALGGLRDAAGDMTRGLPGGAPVLNAVEQAPSDRYYHGTGSAFDTPNPARFDENGLFGPGYYLTSDPRVAGSYAEGGTGAGSVFGSNQTRLENLQREAAEIKGEIADLESGKTSFNHLAPDFRPNPEKLLQNYRGRLATLERYIADDMAAPGPNIRAVDVPAGLRLLDAEAPLRSQPDLLGQIEQSLDPAQVDRFRNAMRDQATRATREPMSLFDVQKGLATTLGSQTEGNRALASAGYDGITYSGGKRIPMMDEAGKNIEHQATVIFPESLPKITNATSGRAGGLLPASGDMAESAGQAVGRFGQQAVGGALAGGYEASQQEGATPGSVLGGAALGAAGGVVRGAIGRRGAGQAIARAVERAGQEGEPASSPGGLNPVLQARGWTSPPASSQPVVTPRAVPSAAAPQTAPAPPPQNTLSLQPNQVTPPSTPARQPARQQGQLPNTPAPAPAPLAPAPPAPPPPPARPPVAAGPGGVGPSNLSSAGNRRLGQMFAKPVPTPANTVPLARRLAANMTDDRAIVYGWEKDLRARGVTPSSGMPELIGDLTRVNPDSRAALRLQPLKETTQTLRDAGVQPPTLSVYLAQVHDTDIAHDFGVRAFKAAVAKGANAVQAQAAYDAAANGRTFSGGRHLPDIMADLQSLEQDLGPQNAQALRDAAQQVWDLNQETLQRKYLAGGMTQAVYQDLVQRYPHYVTTDIVDHIAPDAQLGGTGSSIGQTQAPLKTLSAAGTAKDRLDPLQSVVSNTIRSERWIAKNAPAAAFADLAKADPQSAAMLGVNPSKPGGTKQVTFYDNGQRTEMQLAHPLAEVVTMASGPGGNVAMGIFGSVMRAYKDTITTLSPGFQIVTNPLRDGPDFLIKQAGALGGPQHIPEVVANYGAAVKDVLSEGKWTQAYKAAGGTYERIDTSSKGIARYTKELTASRGELIREPRQLAKIARDILTLGAVPAGQKIEMFPRVAAFKMASERGATPVQAMIAGRNATVPFETAGTFARTINTGVPFFNATVQAGAQFARSMRDHPAGTTASAAAIIGPMALAAQAWNRGDPARKTAYDDVPQYLKDSGTVFMMPWAGSDKRGDLPNYLWLPMGIFMPFKAAMDTAVERTMGDAQPRDFMQALTNVLTAYSPIRGQDASSALSSLLPPGFSTALELANNKDYYRGRTIASDAADQSAGSLAQGITSGLHAVGNALPNAPIVGGLRDVRSSQTEYLIRDLFGSPGQTANAAANLVSGRDDGRNRPVQDVPIVGGLAGRVVRDTGGQQMENARQQMIPPNVDEALRAVGMRPAEVITPVGVLARGIPLNRDEQLQYQLLANTYISDAVDRTITSPLWTLKPADQEQTLRDVINKARSKAADEVLRNVPLPERKTRIDAELQRKAG